MKVRVCRVRECLNNQFSKDVRFFRFPGDVMQNQKWRDNVGIPRAAHLPKFNAYICGKHFEVSAVTGRNLKPGAVPTLHMGHQDVPHKWMPCQLKKTCCIRSCGWKGDETLFKFPREESARSSWALACKVNPSDDKLYVCSRHFNSEYIRTNKVLTGGLPCFYLEDAEVKSPNIQSDHLKSEGFMRVLSAHSNPENLKFDAEKREVLIKDHIAMQLDNFCDIDIQSNISQETNTKVVLTPKRRRIRLLTKYHRNYAASQEKKISILKQKIKSLQLENQDLRRRSIIAGQNASTEAITFAKMIVQTGKRAHYTDDEKNISQNINFMSTKAFNFMRKDLGFALPSKTSLLRWRPIRCVAPGFDVNICKNLMNVAKNMSDIERQCVIIFDEITIKSDLTYNKPRDLVDGFQDIGEGQRELKLGDKCLFFMVKGIASNWKYVFSYYVTKGTLAAEKMYSLLIQNISKLKEIGLNVKATICDQGNINRQMYDKCLRIQQSKPYFMHEGTKIYALYDYCHLIKTVRNNMLGNTFETPDGIVSFRVIKALYDIDKKNKNFKYCPKLTESHISPSNFEKMSVSRAVQVLSNSVAAGIDAAYTQNLFKNQFVKNCAKATQKFVKKCNDIFDDLDAKTLSSKNPYKCPVRRDCTKKIERLKSYLDDLLSWRMYTFNSKGEKVYKISHCFAGLYSTITGMLMLSEELFEQHIDLKFILLGKLNQDALENFFSRVRASLGVNTHPSAHEIQYIVARLTSMKILRMPFENKGNCEDDTDDCLDWTLTPEDRILESKENEELPIINNFIENEHEKEDSTLALKDFDVPDEIFASDEEKAEIQVQRYYTGYAIHQKFLTKLKCEKCYRLFSKTQSDLTHYSEGMIKSKNYKDVNDLRLINPDDRVFELCRLQMKWYSQLFSTHAHKVNLKSFLLSVIKNKTETACPGWFTEEDECASHRLQYLDFLITVLLYKNAKWLLHDTLASQRELAKEKKLKKLNIIKEKKSGTF